MKKAISAICIILGIAILGFTIYNWQKDYMYQDSEMQKERELAEVNNGSINTPPNVNFDKLGNNCVAWIQIPDTKVNYPVYQGNDNVFYLRHLNNRRWSIGGEIFLDADNKAPGLVDNNSILYGHHLKNGTMFEYIAKMTNQNVFNKTQVIWYVTRDKIYKLKPLFTYDAPHNSNKVREFNFTNDKEFTDYLLDLSKNARSKVNNLDTQIKELKYKKVMSLVTCSYDHGKQNYRAIAVLGIDNVENRK